MILIDVNVLVYAHRRDAPDHVRYREWLEGVANDRASFAISELVLSGFMRVVTHPKVFEKPSTLDEALQFIDALTQNENCTRARPGDHHWPIFSELAKRARCRGNLVAHAYHAALAIEHGCIWITTDRDYGRFPGLACRHPLDPA